MKAILTTTAILMFHINATSQLRQKVIDKDSMAHIRHRIRYGHLGMAHYLLRPGTGNRSHEIAAHLLSKLCEVEDPQGMNEMGLLYRYGKGVKRNVSLAFEWFQKSANENYPQAFYNLGTMFQMGISTEQNFKSAFICFKNGSEKGSPSATEALGYMYYKGFGINQNYQEAVKLFRKSSAAGNAAALYMLGVCLRNGYGLSKNEDSAKLYLNRAASKKFKAARFELEEPQGENTGVPFQTPVDNALLQSEQVTLPSSQSFLEGSFAGIVSVYDWSGKYLVEKRNVQLELNRKDDQLDGLWLEEGDEAVPIKVLNGSSIISFDEVIALHDHYHRSKHNMIKINNTLANITYLHDTLTISGRLERYSLSDREPEKLGFFTVKRRLTDNDDALRTYIKENTNVKQLAVGSRKKIDSGGSLFPNPFNDLLYLKIDLASGKDISAQWFSSSGTLQLVEKLSNNYNFESKLLTLKPNIPSGFYRLLIQSGDVKHPVYSGWVIKR